MVSHLRGFAPVLVASVALGGCGAIGSVAKEIGVAACQQAAGGLQNSAARQTAQQACQIAASGSTSQATKAARQVAHDGCVREAAKIIDPIARRQIQALCPQ